MRVIKYVLDCPCPGCEGQLTSGVADFGQPESEGQIVIDVEMSVACTDFDCDCCGCTYFTGDLVIMKGSERDCGLGGDEDDEGDEGDE